MNGREQPSPYHDFFFIFISIILSLPSFRCSSEITSPPIRSYSHVRTSSHILSLSLTERESGREQTNEHLPSPSSCAVLCCAVLCCVVLCCVFLFFSCRDLHFFGCPSETSSSVTRSISHVRTPSISCLFA